MLETDRSYTELLKNFFLPQNNLDVMLIESYRDGLLPAVRHFLREPLVEVLSNHQVVKKLEYLSQLSTLTCDHATAAFRCIKAVQFALHEAAHYTAAFVATTDKDLMLIGIYIADPTKKVPNAAIRLSQKILGNYKLSAQLFVLKAPKYFDVRAKVIYDDEIHEIGGNLHEIDERYVRDLIYKNIQLGLPSMRTYYNEGERADKRVEQILKGHHKHMEPAVVAGAYLVLDMYSAERTGVPGNILDQSMSSYLRRGQWAEVIADDP